MQHLNIEFKAFCRDLDAARGVLQHLRADGPTPDHQIDTYFRVPHGRLKLREGTVERNLIHYRRPDQAGPSRSDVTLFPVPADSEALKTALERALGVFVVVNKNREIWWLDNVKIHLDRVEHLGSFVEVEAIARDGMVEADLREQCEHLLLELDVRPDELIATSYSDMLLNRMH